MPTQVPPLHGDELLSAVTEAMVALHERYHHRRPSAARTRLLEGELLVCVMEGIYTDVEKTMIELQRGPEVREMRSTFQNAMQERFIAEVECLSGRGVFDFTSTSHIGPDLQVEIFLLDPLV